MQPTYLPWAGYFNLVSQVDIFIFLDDVQFEYQSWQTRNQILINGISQWITIPVRRNRLQQLIQDVRIDDQQKWRRKHVMCLQQIYGKHVHGLELSDIFKIIQNINFSYLANLNIQIIQNISDKLGFNVRFLRSSELSQGGKRSEHLYNICKACGCDEYLSPIGSTEYLKLDGIFENSSIKLEFQNYQPAVYSQYKHSDFVSHLSILDVIANLGYSETARYVREGRVYSQSSASGVLP